MTWIFYAFAATIIWAICNILDKVLRTKHIQSSIGLVFLMNLFFVFVSLIIFIFHGLEVSSTKILIIAVITGFCGVSSHLLYFKALSNEEASRVVNLYQFHPIFVLILASIFLGESLLANQYLAFFLILFGGVLISTQKIDAKIKISQAFWLILMASLIEAIASVVDKYVLGYQDYWGSIVMFSIGSLLAIIFMLISRKTRNDISDTVKKLNSESILILVISQTLGVIGFLALFYAIKIGPVSLVNVITNTQGFFVFIYALIFSLWFPKILKEEIDKKTIALKIIAIILMFMGTYYLTV